jgi:hypothetical protein
VASAGAASSDKGVATAVAALERAIDPVRVADGEPSAADETIAR